MLPIHQPFEGWEDMPEAEFIYYRFQVDVDLFIGGRDFSVGLNPVLDFALAWQYLPAALGEQPVVETSMSVQGLTYRVENDGEHVVVASNRRPNRTAKTGFVPHRARLARHEFEALVEQIVDGALHLLYDTHPELRANRYLNGLRERIGR
jgi:hypothetical protein